MNLTTAELAELPVPAALLDDHDTLVARTPEWKGISPGAVSYPVRRNRLVVSTSRADPPCADLLQQLIDAMEDASRQLAPDRAAQMGMLTGSLQLLSGRRVTSSGSASDVLKQAAIGVAARTSLRVEVAGEPAQDYSVAGPEVVALILVQLAANAERHGGASSVVMSARGKAFEVRWRQPGATARAPAQRQRSSRRGWGLGFARIAADTLGGALYPVYHEGGGTTVGSLELGVGRLALPLAMVRDGRIHKATRAWDEETGCEPGTPSDSVDRVQDTTARALRAGGRLVVAEGWWARSVRGGSRVWLAIPPDDVLDRARDVLAGIVHERLLWADISEPHQSRVFALATLLDRRLGEPLPRVPAGAWMRRYRELAEVCGARLPVPELRGSGAIDPRVVLHLVAAGGTRFEFDNHDELYLHVRAGTLGAAVLTAFERRSDGALRLS